METKHELYNLKVSLYSNQQPDMYLGRKKKLSHNRYPFTQRVSSITTSYHIKTTFQSTLLRCFVNVACDLCVMLMMITFFLCLCSCAHF